MDASPAEEAPVRCEACGAENRSQARFCRQCGQALPAAAPACPLAIVAPTMPALGAALDSPAPGAVPLTAEAKLDTEPSRQRRAAELSPTVPVSARPALLGDAAHAAVEAPANPGGDALVAQVEPEAGPLAPGTVVQGRYHIRAVVDPEPGHSIYAVENHARCWSCGAAQVEAGLSFFETCGAALSQWPPARLVELPEVGERREDLMLAHGRLCQLEAARPASAAAASGLRLVAGYQTHTGQVRDVDEETCSFGAGPHARRGAHSARRGSRR